MSDFTTNESVQLRHRELPYQDPDRMTLRIVGGHTEWRTASDLIDAFASRYTVGP